MDEEEQEDANFEADRDELHEDDKNAEEATGVQGGIGDTAPLCDEDKDDDNVEMEQQDKEPPSAEQQMSERFGDDDDAMMMPDEQNGEWQPMEREQQRERQRRRNKDKERKRKEMDDKSNPFRSLGDALSQWKQRLDLIQSDETAQREQDVADSDADDNEDEGGGD